MRSIFTKLQPAVKKETKKVALCTIIGVVLMYVVFGILHGMMPEKIPFDYTIILGGLGGGIIAVLNFFLMGLTVQEVAACTDDDTARMKMKASYTQRMMLQTIWIIVAIVAPCFHYAAGLLPLLFPGAGIKITGIFLKQ